MGALQRAILHKNEHVWLPTSWVATLDKTLTSLCTTGCTLRVQWWAYIVLHLLSAGRVPGLPNFSYFSPLGAEVRCTVNGRTVSQHH